MHPKQILALASLFTTMVSSAPTITTPELVERQDSSPYFLTPLETRAVSAVEERGVVDKRGITIVLFGGDNCTGQQHSIVQDTGSLCYAVPAAKRSLHGVGNCRITTWSGTNCRGSSASIPTTGCINVLYGSVQVDC